METVTVTLETPIKRGENLITSVQLRKPKCGELRGLALSDLVSTKVDAMLVLLPRITIPTLTQKDVTDMDPADLLLLSGEVIGFLMPKADKETTESLTE